MESCTKGELTRNLRKSQRGFTLIELLIILIILGLLGGLVAPQLFKRVGGAKQSTAKTQIAMLGSALDQFRLDLGRYPSSEEGLTALRRHPGIDGWNGPYLTKDIPRDPWQRDYIYRAPGEHSDYDLYSLGMDGQEGGEGENADVLSWE